MFGIATFMGPFLDYLRPAKSPYLVVALAVVIVTGYVLSTDQPDKLYRPDFFLPIYLLLIVVIPLSLNAQRTSSKPAVTEPPDLLSPVENWPETSTKEIKPVDNSKFENDLDSVFKFSRAFGLASGVVMMYVYFASDRPWSVFTILAYTIIIVHMTTFLIYMIFRHFRGEDVSNLNLFQIAFMTVTLFCGATYSGLKIDSTSDNFEPLYYCVKTQVDIAGKPSGDFTPGCEINKEDGTSITHIYSIYRPDFRQITFAVFSICWLVYEIFWANMLVRLAKSKEQGFP